LPRWTAGRRHAHATQTISPSLQIGLLAEYVPKTASVSMFCEVSVSYRHRLQDGCSAN
jgi:hypothetical protein